MRRFLTRFVNYNKRRIRAMLKFKISLRWIWSSWDLRQIWFVKSQRLNLKIIWFKSHNFAFNFRNQILIWVVTDFVLMRLYFSSLQSSITAELCSTSQVWMEAPLFPLCFPFSLLTCRFEHCQTDKTPKLCWTHLVSF